MQHDLPRTAWISIALLWLIAISVAAVLLSHLVRGELSIATTAVLLGLGGVLLVLVTQFVQYYSDDTGRLF